MDGAAGFENDTLCRAAKYQFAHPGAAADTDDNQFDVVLKGDIDDEVARIVVAFHLPHGRLNSQVRGTLQRVPQFCLGGRRILWQSGPEDPQIGAAQGRLINRTLQGYTSFVGGNEANGNTHVYSCLLVGAEG
jgi:hypothetical protein